MFSEQKNRLFNPALIPNYNQALQPEFFNYTVFKPI